MTFITKHARDFHKRCRSIQSLFCLPLLLIAIPTIPINSALATDIMLPNYELYPSRLVETPYLLGRDQLFAQNDAGDDTYDPFADYSEFDDNSDEEADIQFFRHGRFVTLGFAGGFRGFTENLSQMYSSAPTFGLFISYFFDLRMALQLGFLTGDHSAEYVGNGSTVTKLQTNVSMTLINIDLKYFFNTQNVTKGLADLNPYIIGGFSQIYRTITFAGNAEQPGKDNAMGLNLGVGLEIPVMRKKGFFGPQFTYRYFTFEDENKNILLGTNPNVYSNDKPAGDSFDFLLILGLNY